MKNKLRCVLVDDDPFMHKVVKDLCVDSALIDMVDYFSCPKQFLSSVPAIDFDLCLLGICMSDMNGILVAKQLKSKMVIFVTGAHDHLLDAIESSPVDILLKPLKRERFFKAIEKANSLNMLNLGKSVVPVEQIEKQKYALFNVAESKAKLRILLSDIFYVKHDSDDSRNKLIIMKDGRQYTLMRATFEELLQYSSTLAQVNRSELISTDAVQNVRHDLITLKFQDMKESIIKQVTLNRTYRKNFMVRLQK
ncbi:MAG TPA: response regulator [Bacteroidia bacterium]|jgi:two-component system LytT family response regulator|nr:response regulator [Bacteroidia bacterium]